MPATTRKTPQADVPNAEQVTEEVTKISERVTAQTRELTDQAREFADQARDYSEQFIASAKTMGNYALDAYEQAANTVLGVQAKVAESVKADWLPSIVPAAINANVKFAEDVHAAYVKAARSTLA